MNPGLVRKASWEGLCPDSVVIRSVTVTYYYFSFGYYLVQLLSDLVHVVSVPEHHYLLALTFLLELLFLPILELLWCMR